MLLTSDSRIIDEKLLCGERKVITFADAGLRAVHHMSGCGVIGSRARLRIWCRKTCRFESYHPHEGFGECEFTFHTPQNFFLFKRNVVCGIVVSA